MSNVIDEKIVEMRFDNQDFEKNVKESMSTLEKLKGCFNFRKEEQAFDSLQRAADRVNFNSFAQSAEQASQSFDNFMNTVGNVWAIKKAVDALDGLENKVRSVVKSMTFDQIGAGWSKYEQKTQAVQTIISATGKDIDEVNEQLEKLNWFSDETSYSFTDMTSSVGKFTSAGVDLKTAVKAIMGISTWAAKAGQGTNEAGRAMYNLAQAISVGSVKLMDWKSIENANMGTIEFKKAALEAAVAVGTLRKEGEKYVTLKKGMTVTAEKFNDSLQQEWFTTEVLLKVLQRYGGYAEDIYNFMQDSGEYDTAAEAMANYTGEVDELGRSSFLASQEAITLKQAIEATKDAVSSGWMVTFETIFGDYTEAKKSWTELANVFWEIFAGGGKDRNDFLKNALASSGRGLFEDFAENFGLDSDIFYKAVGEVLKEAGYQLRDFHGEYESLADFAKNSDIWVTPERVADALELVRKSLDLQNGSTEEIAENWNALQKTIEDVAGDSEDFRNELGRVLQQHGVDVMALIDKYGDFDTAIAHTGIVSSEILGETFTNLSKTSLDYSKTIEGGNLSLKEFEKIFADVNKGVYGVGTERIKKFTEAGYDAAKMQELINKRSKAGYKITAEDLKGVRLQETIQVEGLSKAYASLGELYTTTGENAEEMARRVLESGDNLNWMVENMDGVSGREMLFDSLLTVLEHISQVIGSFREAWNDLFMSDPVGLTKAIASLNVFIHSFDMGEEQFKDLYDIFHGILSVLLVVKTAIGGVLGLLSPIFGKLAQFAQELLHIFGIVGEAISIVNDLLIVDMNDFFLSIPGRIAEGFEKLNEIIGPLKEKFINLFTDENGANKFLDTIEKIKTAFDLLKSKWDEIKGIFQSIFKAKEEISDPRAIKEGLFSKLTKVFDGLQPIIDELKQKFSELFGPEIEKISNVINTIKEKAAGIGEALQPVVDWITKLFSVDFSGGLETAITSIQTKFESVKKTVSELIDKVKKFFGGGEEDKTVTNRVKGSLGIEENDKTGKVRASKGGESLVEKLASAKDATLLDKIKIILKDVAERVWSLIKVIPGLNLIVGKLRDKFKSLAESIQNSEIYQRLKEIFDLHVAPAVGKAIEFVKEKFLALKEAIQNSTFFQTIKKFFEERISPAIGEAFDKLKNKIENIGQPFETLRAKITDFKNFFANNEIFKKVTDFLNVNVKPAILDVFENFGKKIKDISQILKGENPIENLLKYFKENTFSGKILSSITKGLSGIMNFVSKNKGAALGGLGIFGIVLGFKKLPDLMNTVTNVLGLFSGRGPVDKILNFLNGFKKKEKETTPFAETLLNLAKAIGIIAASIFVIGNMDDSKLIKGAIGVGAILLALTLAIKNIEKQEIGKSENSIKALGDMMLDLAGIMVILSQMKPESLIKSGIAIAGLFTIIVIAFRNLSSGKTDIATSKESMVGLSTVLRNMAYVVRIIGTMKLGEALQGVGGLYGLVGALKLLLRSFTSLTGPLAISGKVIFSLGITLMMLTGSVAILGNMDTGVMIQGVIGLIAVVGILRGLFIALGSLTGPIAIGAGAILAIGVVTWLLSKVVENLGNSENIQNGIIALAEIMAEFVVVGLAMAGFGAIAGIAMVGLGAFTLFVMELWGVIELLKATTLSSMAGSQLMQLADGLGSFMEKIEPFILGCERLGRVNFAKSVKNLVEGLVILLGVDFLDNKVIRKITGHSVFDIIGDELESFGRAIHRFIQGVYAIDEATEKDVDLDTDKIQKVMDMIPKLAELTKINYNQSSTIKGFFTGNMQTFGKGLKELGKGLREFARAAVSSGLFSEKIEVPGDTSNFDQIKNAVSILKNLSEIEAPTFVKIKILDWFQADNSFTTWGTQIKTLGEKLVAFANSVVGSKLFTGNIEVPDDTSNISQISNAVAILQALSEIVVPTTFTAKGGIGNLVAPIMGIFGEFSANNNLSSWGKQLESFGPEFVSFCESITNSGLFDSPVSVNGDEATVGSNLSAIESALGIIKKLTEIQPPEFVEGKISFPLFEFLGAHTEFSNTLETLGTQINEFIPKFISFGETIVGSDLFKPSLGIGEDEVNAATKNIETINAVTDIIVKLAGIDPPPAGSFYLTKWITGDKSLTTFGSELGQFATGIITFVQTLNSTYKSAKTLVVNDDSVETVNKAIGIVSSLLSLTVPDDIKNKKSILEFQTLAGLGGDIEALGKGIGEFIRSVASFGAITEFKTDDATIGIAVKALDIVKELANLEIPEQGNFATKFFNLKSDLGIFANDIGGFGKSLYTIVRELNGVNEAGDKYEGNVEVTEDSINKVLAAIPVIRALATIPNPNILDATEWSNLASALDIIGPAFRQFVIKFNEIGESGEEINYESIDNVTRVLPIINTLSELARNVDGKVGEKFEQFGKSIKTLVDPLKDFITNVSDLFKGDNPIDSNVVANIISIISSIASIAEAGTSESGVSATGETFLERLGRNVSEFVQRINSITFDEEKVNQLKELIGLLQNGGSSGNLNVKNLSLDNLEEQTPKRVRPQSKVDKIDKKIEEYINGWEEQTPKKVRPQSKVDKIDKKIEEYINGWEEQTSKRVRPQSKVDKIDKKIEEYVNGWNNEDTSVEIPIEFTVNGKDPDKIKGMDLIGYILDNGFWGLANPDAALKDNKALDETLDELSKSLELMTDIDRGVSSAEASSGMTEINLNLSEMAGTLALMEASEFGKNIQSQIGLAFNASANEELGKFNESLSSIAESLNTIAGVFKDFQTIQFSDNIVEQIKAIADLLDFFDKFYNAGYALGEDIALGLADGIRAGTVAYVEPAAADMGAAAIASTKKKVDSNSPSKEFEKIGKWIDEGLALGITKNARAVKNASKDLGDVTKEGFGSSGAVQEMTKELGKSGSVELGKRMEKDFAGETKDGSSFITDLLNGWLDKIKKAPEPEEIAEETTKKIVNGGYKGANNENRERLKEVVRDDIAGVADMTLSEFETRKGDMINSAQDLVIKLAEAVRAASPLFHSAGAELGSSMQEGLTEQTKPILEFMGLVKALASSLGETYANRFKQYFGEIIDFINEKLATLNTEDIANVSELLTGLQNSIETFDPDTEKLSLVTDTLKDISDAAAGLINVDPSSIVAFVQAIADSFQNNQGLVTTAANATVEAIVAAFETWYSRFITIGINFIVNLADGLQRGIPIATSAAMKVASAIVDALSGSEGMAATAGEKFMSDFAQGMSSEGAAAKIQNALDKLFGGGEETTEGTELQPVQDVTGGTEGESVESGSYGQKFGQKFVSDTVAAIESGAPQIINSVEAIKEKLSEVKQSFADLGSNISFTGFYGVGKEMLKSFNKDVAPAVIIIKNKMNSIFPDGAAKIYAMMEGMIAAFNDDEMVQRVVDAATNFANKVSAALSGCWEINSPSKVTMRMGYGLIEGVQLGIERKGHLGVETAKTWGERVVDATEDAFEEFESDGIQKAFSIVSKMVDMMDENMDYDPVITPVVDISNVRSGASQISSLLSRQKAYDIGAQFTAARQAQYLQNEHQTGEKLNSNTYNFTQNNYSPKHLTNAEIYRQTKNQLAQLKNI